MERIISIDCSGSKKSKSRNKKNKNKHIKVPDTIICEYMTRRYGVFYKYSKNYDTETKKDIEIDTSDGNIYVCNKRTYISHEYLGDKINCVPLRDYLTDIYDPILISILKEYKKYNIPLKVIDDNNKDNINKGENI